MPGPLSMPQDRRKRASLAGAVVCATLWVALAVFYQRLSWSLPVAAAWFAWRGLRSDD